MRIRRWMWTTMVLLLPAGLAAAATFTLEPVADTFVSSSSGAGSYGAAGAVTVSATGLSNGEFQSLMKFDPSAMKTTFDSAMGIGGWKVDSLVIQLNATAPKHPMFNASSAGSIAVRWMVSDAWVEGSGNPNSPGADGVSFNAIAGFTGAGVQALGSIVYDGLTSGSSMAGLTLASPMLADLTSGNPVSLQLLAGDETVSGVFFSVNNSSGHPSLTVVASAVPEPGMALLSLSVVWLACSGFRRRGIQN